MKTIDELSLNGKRVFVRVDFNVPLDKNTYEVTDDTRIRSAIPTIRHILKEGGSVILASHLGRPKNGPEDALSLRHVLGNLEKHLGQPVQFISDCRGEAVKKASESLKPGEVLLLENLRFYKEEEAGEENFSKELASLADIYVNDAFGTAHRRHASTAAMAEYFPGRRAAGFLMGQEVKAIGKVLHEAERPFVAVVGGAKVSSKMAILENLFNRVDAFIIGGGMVFTFVQALGGKTGSSLVEQDMIDTAAALLKRCKESGKQLLLPADSICAQKFANEGPVQNFLTDAIPEGWMGLDIGPEAVKQFREVLMNAKTILWNGPMGVFEMSLFSEGTKKIAEALGDATEQKGTYTLVGGGDSVAAVNQFGQAERVSYVSTGGGAMLEFMEGRVLPGVAAIAD